MPSLEFKGKQFVYSHHLSVPFRELIVDAKKSLPAKGQKPSLDDNLIIHGDNLEALKALLPTHSGKVDCIFIDPPYNTGGDWCYNDKVNSPLMKEWLKEEANPVDKEDLERHDKWAAMMWPRLQLLHELLSEDGFIAVTIDENEDTNLSKLLDDIFGEEKRVALAPWKAEPSGGKQKSGLRIGHEFVLVYHKRDPKRISKEESEAEEHNLEDETGTYYKGRELLKWGAGSLKEDRETMWFPIKNPDGNDVYPIRNDGKNGRWRLGKDNKYIQEIASNPIAAHWEMRPFDSGVKVGGKESRWVPYEKIRSDSKMSVFGSWLDYVGTNADGTSEIKQIFGDKAFDTPKPTSLVKWVLGLIPNDDAIILDSFAGSATTGHAVLSQNELDGGNRRFILIECEDYANTLTAERTRRVIQGYKFQGTQREEIYTERITWSNFSKKAKEICEKVESVEQFEGAEFDTIKKEIKNGVLTVTGERKIEEKAPGLGGSFTFCELGEPINIKSLLTGEDMPGYEALARYVFYTATGQSLEKLPKTNKTGFIAETELFRVHLIYQPDKAWLRSNEAALNAERVEAIAKENKNGKRAVVFAVAKFMSQKELTKRRIEFCQLPYAVHRILGD